MVCRYAHESGGHLQAYMHFTCGCCEVILLYVNCKDVWVYMSASTSSQHNACKVVNPPHMWSCVNQMCQSVDNYQFGIWDFRSLVQGINVWFCKVTPVLFYVPLVLPLPVHIFL